MRVVHAHMAMAFQRVDATHLDAERLHAQLTAAAEAPFDLEHDPVFRTHLFSRGDENVLLLNSHHIAGDTWSLIVMMEELGQLYQARLTRREARLAADSLS
jgi:NRPS condensation-like uncharacterized protein